MELETVAASVAGIAVRSIADCCAIAMRTGPVGRGVMAVARASELDAGVDAAGLRTAAETCALELMAADDAGPLLVEASDRDVSMVPERARAAVAALSARGVRSLLAVPFAPRGERLGMILLAIVGETAGYDRSDFSAVEELAHRAAIAFDNVRLYGEAQEALRAREDLLAIVSHDLRNPLGVVLASSALLLKSSLPPEREERARRQVEAIQRAGNRMNRLIRDLLDFASIQAGHLSVSTRPQAVGDMVSEVLEALEPLAAAKSQRLHADVPPGMEMRCDHDRVIQLFSNVVGNAIKFTPDGGRNPHYRLGRPAGQPAGALRRDRHRAGNPCRRAAARLRSLLPGPAQEPGGHRPGADDRARHRRGARGADLGRKRGGQGEHLPVHAGARLMSDPVAYASGNVPLRPMQRGSGDVL